MNVKSITSNFAFSAKLASRRDNTDRVPTVQDLYEMEDRINAYQENLIAQQNANIAKALIYMQTGEQHIYSKQCKNSAKIIRGIMAQPQPQTEYFYDPRFGEAAAKYLDTDA